ncbi:DNA repair and recombination protein RadA [Candidatus Geothermarchaeota archaeon]|mgnify:FL=1|nr:MAG: DNA repair and recombination protein RadA [Candidatus Geothermarchaeota archaeon]
MSNEGLDIDVRELPGVGEVTARKLKEAGIYTVRELLLYSPIYLSELLNISEERAEKLVITAHDFLRERGLISDDFISAEELLEKIKRRRYITTGSRNLDNLLKGGIATQAVTEFYGEFGSGKTQLCHTLAVNVQLPESEGGLNQNAIYIDTEKTFSPSRIVEIATAKGLNPSDILKNIIVARAYNTTHLLLLIKMLPEKIKSNNVGLVAIDSAVAPFRAEYLGRGKLAERQQLLNRLMHDLIRIAELYDAAIVITNQVQAQPDIMFGDPTKPVGGHVVAHAVTYRIYLRKAKQKGLRIASIVDSPEHPPGETLFLISEEGITDPTT